MADTFTPRDSVRELEAHLKREAESRAKANQTFDMNDSDDLTRLDPFPQCQAAIAWLEGNVTQPWGAADEEAKHHQGIHKWLARTAIATGAGAIVLAILQLALRQSWPGLAANTAWLEGTIVLAGVVSVVMGLWAKSDRKWLGCRHRAERLRMLKFRALARVELWEGKTDEWHAWVRSEMAQILAMQDADAVEKWCQADATESDLLTATASPAAPEETCRALAAYYRHKRLLNQSDYFRQAQEKAAANWAVRMRHCREWVFFITIGCVILHFVADYAAGTLEHQGSAGAAQAWELASLWGIVLAAVLPVMGIGVRAWSAAFESSRRARTFAAKHQAMARAAANLQTAPPIMPIILAHMRHDELFLEQEHREWLRLLIDAEWFL